jgi:hypothetical protein
MGSYRAKVYNDNKVAKYMLGTKTMIPRPILQKLIQKIGNKFTVSMQKVIGKING